MPFHAGRSVRHATRPEASTFAPPPAHTFPSCTSHPLPLLDSRAVALFACKLQTVTCEGAQPAWQREAVTTRCTTVAQHHTLEYSSEGWFGSEGALPEGLTGQQMQVGSDRRGARLPVAASAPGSLARWEARKLLARSRTLHMRMRASSGLRRMVALHAATLLCGWHRHPGAWRLAHPLSRTPGCWLRQTEAGGGTCSEQAACPL